MTHHYTLFVDESGCDGIANFRPPGHRGGTSHWLVISGMIARTSDYPNLLTWRNQILELFPNRNKRDLHFTDFKHEQKIQICKHLSKLPLTSCAILSNKTTIPEHPRADLFKSKNTLYWYLCRYLIERISVQCGATLRKNGAKNRTIKIIFSCRGGMDYLAFREYLHLLKSGKTKIETPDYIDWSVIDIDAVEAFNHSNLAGLQLADCFTSAVAAGVEPNSYGDIEPRYAKILKKRFLKNSKGHILGTGIKPVPSLEKMKLTTEQQEFFNVFE